MLKTENCIFILVDVQGNLAQSMVDKENLFKNLKILIEGLKILKIPIVWVEQTPDKLGATIPEIAELVEDQKPIKKSSFSGYGSEQFKNELNRLKRSQVIIAGIETHVCVYQTVMDLLENGYLVEVVADAVSSRTAENRDIGLTRMTQAGATVTSTEMVLFELLQQADEGPEFKQIIKLVK